LYFIYFIVLDLKQNFAGFLKRFLFDFYTKTKSKLDIEGVEEEHEHEHN